jgi:AcrR family transcriptional regulator
VLAAAREVFAERGLAGATLDDVAGAAGLTKGAVYSNFAGKDDLILALMEDRVADRIEAVAAAFAAAGSSTGGVRDAGATLIASVHADADWQRLFIEFWARAMRDDGLRDVLVERRRALRRTIAQALERGAAEHGLRLAMPADHLAVTILALSNGLAIESLLDPDAVPDELFGRLLTHLVDVER